MTNLTFRPMLACSTIPDMKDIKFPVIASPKLDGIRCIMADGLPWSRSMKLIPNLYVRAKLKELQLHGFDGELMLKDGADFNSVQSAFMSEHGEPDFVYNIFDCWDLQQPFCNRLDGRFRAPSSNLINLVPNREVNNVEELIALWGKAVKLGYEGLIIRDPKAPYKQGRSTLKQGWMLKLKKFKEDEAEVVGFEELMHNHNAATEGELGQTIRTKHQANMVAGNSLGALLVKWQDKEFKLGTGFTQVHRDYIWKFKDKYLGIPVTFKYQELSKYGIPRFPVFKGFRHE